MTPPARITRRVHYGIVVLALIVLAVFGALGLGRFGYTSILPAMQEALRLTNAQTGELQSWNLVGYVATVLAAGVLAARFGPRVVISLSLLLTALAMSLTGLVPTFGGARFGRFLAGVGGAGTNVPSMGLVSAWFGGRRRGLASGIGVAGSSVGLIFTGPFVPWIEERYGAMGWRVSWCVLGAMTLAAAVTCALFLRNGPGEKGLVPIGETAADRTRRGAGAQASSLDWALVYKSPALWHLAAVYFAFGFAYIIYSTFFIQYLVKECGFTQARAGLMWSKIGLGSGVSGLLWGSISDRWGRRRALCAVFVLQAASFLCIGLDRSLTGIGISAALFAVTAWSVPALMAALAGDLFGTRLAPAALGLMTVVFGIGQALGPYAAGRIADAAGSFAPAFVAAGVLALLLGAGGSLTLRLGSHASVPAGA